MQFRHKKVYISAHFAGIPGFHSSRPISRMVLSYIFFCHFPDYNENGTGRTQEEGEWLSPDSIYFLSPALHKRKKEGEQEEENNIFHILIGF